MKSKLYPKKDGHRYAYVQYAIMVTESVIESAKRQELPLAGHFKVGQWIAVDVLLPTGYAIPFNRISVDSEEVCQKGCDVHNRFHGFTQEDIIEIVSASMELA